MRNHDSSVPLVQCPTSYNDLPVLLARGLRDLFEIYSQPNIDIYSEPTFFRLEKIRDLLNRVPKSWFEEE